MTLTLDPADLVDQHVQENYRQVRLQNGWTWAELAADFERSAGHAAGIAGGIGGQDEPYRLLARWATAEGEREAPGDPAQREGTTPAPAQPGPKKRTATPPGPQRTA